MERNERDSKVNFAKICSNCIQNLALIWTRLTIYVAGSIQKQGHLHRLRKVLVQPGHAQFVREAGSIQDAAERISALLCRFVRIGHNWGLLGVLCVSRSFCGATIHIGYCWMFGVCFLQDPDVSVGAVLAVDGPVCIIVSCRPASLSMKGS